jgi:hypothetical protein
VQTTGEGFSSAEGIEAISRQAAAEKVGLERFRARTPKPNEREAATFTPVSDDHPIRQPWKAGVMQDWQIKALGSLGIERQLPDPEAKVVLAPDALTANRVYIERLDPAGEGDSGWYLGSADENAEAVDPAKLIAVRLADLLAARTDFTDLLGLPNSTLVILDAGGPAAIFDALGLDIWALALIKAAEPPPADAAQGAEPAAGTQPAEPAAPQQHQPVAAK